MFVVTKVGDQEEESYQPNAGSKMKFVLIELIILAVPLRHNKNVDLVAKTQGYDAASAMLAFMIIASKNGMIFNRLKTVLELPFL